MSDMWKEKKANGCLCHNLFHGLLPKKVKAVFCISENGYFNFWIGFLLTFRKEEKNWGET